MILSFLDKNGNIYSKDYSHTYPLLFMKLITILSVFTNLIKFLAIVVDY